MKEKAASFLVPPLIAVVLLYQVLATLRIAVTHGATLLLIGIVLAIACAAGILAAFGPPMVRVVVLAASTLVLLDVTFHLSAVFDHLRPRIRKQLTNDEKRIADLHRIKSALDQYVTEYGALPAPAEYGEGTGLDGFWENWWDLSAHDGDGDGVPFLGFLVDAGILPMVPSDPVNEPSANGDPHGGKQYVYFLVPAGYDYAGGASDARPDRFHYLLAITDLALETSRPPIEFAGSGCASLWRDEPNFFQKHFDYVLCGTYDATPASVARAAAARAKLASEAGARRVAELRAKRDAAALAQKGAAARIHLPQDRRRVADLLQIRQGLQKYLATVGPLPPPAEYGEAEPSSGPGFWQRQWDVSSDDGDGDGKAFLDFLVESGTMQSVPVDPDNEAPRDGDPRGGKQYVYLLVPPDYPYEGGSCVSSRKWVYMLGITDLESEVTRPPVNITGSGCGCLWRNQPDFFQQHFDYVTCGVFEATPESVAKAAAARAKLAADALAAEQAAKHAAAGRIHVPQDRRRVADLLQIRQGLQKYLATVGPLPAPAAYGEAEPSSGPGFWQHQWDVSSDDGDGDGKAFLDFLVESGTMQSVPVDPDNEAPGDGDPQGGKQYVYFLVPPENAYQGGSCVSRKNEWVYMLGITDLESEAVRPPANISGSGCGCLWSDQPNYFQQHFDYVICGTFSR